MCTLCAQFYPSATGCAYPATTPAVGETRTTVTAAATDVFTLDQIALQLSEVYWGGYQTRFNVTTGDVLTYDVSRLTTVEQTLALAAFESWAVVSGLQFRPASSFASADIRFQHDDAGAYTSTVTTWRGDYDEIQSVMVNISSEWIATYGQGYDSYSFQTYIHEIGHALGLGHPGNYNVTGVYGDDNEFANDSWQATVMSYFSQVDNFTILADYAYVVSPMMADIIAIQDLYGIPAAARSGDTTYGTEATVGGYLAALFGQISGEDPADPALYSGSNVTFTLYDTGGIDTLDLSSVAAAIDQILNLTPGSISDIFGVTGSLSIDRSTVIENARLGAGNDQVQGNDVDNRLYGGLGDDTIDGALGNDSISGGEGLDDLSGGIGADILNGRDGDDLIDGGDGNDLIRGGSGNDTISGGAGNDAIYGHAGDDWIDAGTGDDTLRGQGDDDVILGGAGNDALDGGCGDDSLDGGDDNDTIFGAPGRDMILGGAGNDLLVGGSHDDTLDGGTGNDMLRGDNGNDLLDGGDGQDSLSGGAGNDTLLGGIGADYLTGGSGDDLLAGGADADIFVFGLGDGADTVSDFVQGTDAIWFDPVLWGGGLTASEVVLSYAAHSAGTTVFTFASDSLTLAGLADLGTLADDIVFI